MYAFGNMVSQIVATFYLDELDKFIQRELKIKAFCRYMDDFYCMHEDKEYLKELTDMMIVSGANISINEEDEEVD